MSERYFYGIIGSGRLARHFAHYFSIINLPFKTWSRKENPNQDPALVLQDCSHIWLLISDDAILPFYQAHPFLKDKVTLHASGSLYHPDIIGAHPLMTFSEDVYDLHRYTAFRFIVDHPIRLPGFKNVVHSIAAEKKALYHALCVMSGNYTTLLWQKAFQDFSTKLGVPADALTPYLKQTFENLSRDRDKALTGPLVRGDQKTIENNIEALKGDPYQRVYQAFVEAYREARKL
jgi:hypothetical protein